MDAGVLELLFPSQELSKSVPTILTPDSLNDTLLLNESKAHVMPKQNNSIKFPNRSKRQSLDEIAPEEVIPILENVHVEMIVLKSFIVDYTHIM